MIEIRTVVAWGEGHTEEWLEDAWEKNSQVKEMCYVLIWVVVIKVYTFFTTFHSLCLQWVHFVEWRLQHKFSQSTKRNKGEQSFRGYIPPYSIKPPFLNMIYWLDQSLKCLTLTLTLTYLLQPITTSSKLIVFPQAVNFSFIWTFIYIAPCI